MDRALKVAGEELRAAALMAAGETDAKFVDDSARRYAVDRALGDASSWAAIVQALVTLNYAEGDDTNFGAALRGES